MLASNVKKKEKPNGIDLIVFLDRVSGWVLVCCNSVSFLIWYLFLLTDFVLILLMDTEEHFDVHVLPLDVSTPRDFYVWNYRDLGTLLTLSESSAECGFEPLTIGSVRKNLTTLAILILFVL